MNRTGRALTLGCLLLLQPLLALAEGGNSLLIPATDAAPSTHSQRTCRTP